MSGDERSTMKTDQHLPARRDPASEFLIYQTEAGATKIEVRLEDETVWLTQRLMADLFQKDVRTTNEHIANVYDEGELAPEATIRKFRIVQREGEREVARIVDHYNLDMIISVGYRVKSHVATRFRIWATQRLREYIDDAEASVPLLTLAEVLVTHQDRTAAPIAETGGWTL